MKNQRRKDDKNIVIILFSHHFLLNFAPNLLLFYVFHLFSTNNAENDYFDKNKGCPNILQGFSSYITDLLCFLLKISKQRVSRPFKADLGSSSKVGPGGPFVRYLKVEVTQISFKSILDGQCM